jgi:hypothetical protein
MEAFTVLGAWENRGWAETLGGLQVARAGVREVVILESQQPRIYRTAVIRHQKTGSNSIDDHVYVSSV